MRLLDNAQKRIWIRNREGTPLRASAQIFHQQFELMRQFVGRVDLFGDFPRRITRQDKTVIALALQQHAFENVFAQIDANDKLRVRMMLLLYGTCRHSVFLVLERSSKERTS